MLLPRGHTHLVESARDRTDALGGGGVHLEHLANDGGLIVDDLEVRCPILGLVNVAIPVGCGTEHADLALVRAMPLAPARTLENLGSLVLGDHALELQEQLVFGRVRLRCIDEDCLHAVTQPFFDKQDLVRIFATQPIRRQNQHSLDLTFGDQVAHSLQPGSNQCRAADAFVLENPFSRNRVPLAASVGHQRRSLAGNGLVLLLLIRGHPGVDCCGLHDTDPLLERRRYVENDPEPGCRKPVRAWRSTDDQSNTQG